MQGAPFSDDDLLALVRQTEARERTLAAIAAADEEEDGPTGDACLHCGEPAVASGTCAVCGAAGCLPRDDWAPGWGEPCLARCARCGVLFHADCGGVNEAGNPACGGCAPAFEPGDL